MWSLGLMLLFNCSSWIAYLPSWLATAVLLCGLLCWHSPSWPAQAAWPFLNYSSQSSGLAACIHPHAVPTAPSISCAGPAATFKPTCSAPAVLLTLPAVPAAPAVLLLQVRPR